MDCNDQNLTRTGLAVLLRADLKFEITGLFGPNNIAPVRGSAHTGGLLVLDGAALLWSKTG